MRRYRQVLANDHDSRSHVPYHSVSSPPPAWDNRGDARGSHDQADQSILMGELEAVRHRRAAPEQLRRGRRALWENRDQAGYAWRIISQGVCDGCALGVAGLHDWTQDGVHLCNIRLRLLRLNTMGALDTSLLGGCDDATRPRPAPNCANLAGCRYPMVRRKGDTGFSRRILGRGA